ncbi:MAG: RNA ligase family protein [Pseudomonadota bacterium]
MTSHPPALRKFPRTRHIEGSRRQAGDDADDQPLSAFAGHSLVATEKLDGANAGLSFAADGTLLLQSRGHYLTGGGRERHFALFKTWANTHAPGLRNALGARHVMYGEWLFAKHTVFYDRLPHYFFEFDVLDRESGQFLSSGARRDLLYGLPIVPAPVLPRAEIPDAQALTRLIGPARYKSADWRDALARAAAASGSRPEHVARQTEDSDLAEGVYLKQEDDDTGRVVERAKYVRGDFVQAIKAADSHWLSRPILPNQLAPGVDILAPQTGVTGAYDDPDA